MPEVEIRPGVRMAYEDHWFGNPWTTPETVVMVHGNCESSRAWAPWVPHLAGQYRMIRPGAPPNSRPTSGGFSMRSPSRAAT
jgi:pimeloyl-ACP methyl ester carboxylesterase